MLRSAPQCRSLFRFARQSLFEPSGNQRVSAGTDHEQIVHVNLHERSYDIVIGNGHLSQSGEIFKNWLQERHGVRSNPSCLIITDQNVTPIAEKVRQSLDSHDWKTDLFAIEAGEQSKRLEVASQLWDRLVDHQADRKTIVISVGGGVVGDAGGFVAATFARGVPFIQVPTTVLAAVDSAVGGKVGINHPKAKNLIGAFHQPLGVLIDTDEFKTLPDRDYRSGLAEIVKYGVILDSDFFEFLEQHAEQLNDRDPATLRTAIARSCELKAYVVENDEYETTGLRAVLNYGHTFAHAYEALIGYGELMHGEAVAIGMVDASRLAEKCGRIDTKMVDRQVKLLEALHLPTQLKAPGELSVEDVLGRMRLDKKTVAGKLRFVLPTKIGHVELVDGVDETHVRSTLIEHGLTSS